MGHARVAVFGILIVTFFNEEQYDNREEPYFELLKEIGQEKLMNDKKQTCC